MSRTLRASLNEANPNLVPTDLQRAKAGDALALIPAFAAGAVASDILVLPENAKAAQVLRCWAAGPDAYLLPVAQESTPGAGEVAVAPNGDLIFAAADSVTAAEVVYVAMEGEVFEETLPVAASALEFPQGRTASVLLECEVITGVVPGTETVIARAGTPAATEAALTADGSGVAFNVADVIAGTARVKYIAQPSSAAPSLATRLASTAAY